MEIPLGDIDHEELEGWRVRHDAVINVIRDDDEEVVNATLCYVDILEDEETGKVIDSTSYPVIAYCPDGETAVMFGYKRGNVFGNKYSDSVSVPEEFWNHIVEYLDLRMLEMEVQEEYEDDYWNPKISPASLPDSLNTYEKRILKMLLDNREKHNGSTRFGSNIIAMSLEKCTIEIPERVKRLSEE